MSKTSFFFFFVEKMAQVEFYSEILFSDRIILKQKTRLPVIFILKYSAIELFRSKRRVFLKFPKILV